MSLSEKRINYYSEKDVRDAVKELKKHLEKIAFFEANFGVYKRIERIIDEIFGDKLQ